MCYLFTKNTVLLFVLTLLSCGKLFTSEDQSTKHKVAVGSKIPDAAQTDKGAPIVGANRTEKYIPLLKGKRVGIVANQTSVIFKDKNRTHLVDSLLALQVNVVTVFSPEHGFRGQADAAEHVADGVDTKTGLPIISLHGKTRKPLPEHLKAIDVMVFDIQDVGVRFYTYISTLHYVMEACAENNIPLIILDRPNPNGNYVDGPVLNPKHKSFVGMHPVALVHGMTIGEYAQMINGEKWLANGAQCDITIISVENYTHETPYSLPIKPSPNLPNDKAINLYPSLGLFEGTTINAGRGTDFQFQRYGAPFFPKTEFSYTPLPNEGAKHPKHEGKLCYGVDLTQEPELHSFTLKYIIDAYQKTPKSDTFFGPTFTIHAGNETLQKQIAQGLSEAEIRKSWKEGLENYKTLRKKYLLYP
ncbi:MAG TPA: DUF1343 domain-containing protein [Mangrovimonas sp.]|nr:DUF1343 domain-containing protein [Mangrovimonas sp.]